MLLHINWNPVRHRQHGQPSHDSSVHYITTYVFLSSILQKNFVFGLIQKAPEKYFLHFRFLDLDFFFSNVAFPSPFSDAMPQNRH